PLADPARPDFPVARLRLVLAHLLGPGDVRRQVSLRPLVPSPVSCLLSPVSCLLFLFFSRTASQHGHDGQHHCRFHHRFSPIFSVSSATSTGFTCCYMCGD